MLQVEALGLRLHAAPGSAVAERVRKAAGRWVWPLQMAYAIDELPAPEVWERLPGSDGPFRALAQVDDRRTLYAAALAHDHHLRLFAGCGGALFELSWPA